MDEIVADLAGQHAELRARLAGLDEHGWQAPSACAGWTVADVVLHLAQTDEMAIGSLAGTFDSTLADLLDGLPGTADMENAIDLMVAKDRGLDGPAVFERWSAGAAALDELFTTTDLHARVLWVAGELSARTLATTRLAECWIHTGDVDAAFGIPPQPWPRIRHIARLAWRTLPYAFARSGRTMTGGVAFELDAPDGSTWTFRPEGEVLTTITGGALDLCLVAGQRARAADTSLRGAGPDAASALELVRTFA